MNAFWSQLGNPPITSDIGGCNHFVVLDAAQIDRYASLIAAFHGAISSVALFGDPLAPSRRDATPHLLELHGLDSFPKLARILERAEASHGALTWLISPLTQTEITTRLKIRLDARLPDDYDCVNRFFDGRIAPHLHSALTPEQRRDFFSVAEQWWVIAPNYQWLSLECQFSDEDQFSGPLSVTAAQEASLIDGCYPYAVLEHFEHTDPELLETIPVAQRYAFIREALQAARRFGIESGSEAVLFCTLSLTRGERFHETPAWHAGLEQVLARETTLQQVVRNYRD